MLLLACVLVFEWCRWAALGFSVAKSLGIGSESIRRIETLWGVAQPFDGPFNYHVRTSCVCCLWRSLCAPANVCVLLLLVVLIWSAFVTQCPRVFVGTTLHGRPVVLKALYMDSMELWALQNLTGNDSLCIVPVENLLSSPIGVYHDTDVCLVCMPQLIPLRDAMRRGGLETAVVGSLIAQLLRVSFMVVLIVVVVLARCVAQAVSNGRCVRDNTACGTWRMGVCSFMVAVVHVVGCVYRLHADMLLHSCSLTSACLTLANTRPPCRSRFSARCPLVVYLPSLVLHLCFTLGSTCPSLCPFHVHAVGQLGGSRSLPRGMARATASVT